MDAITIPAIVNAISMKKPDVYETPLGFASNINSPINAVDLQVQM
jgi:hypothetical protein